MDKEISKNKINLLKSIMQNPRLSRTLRDAMKAPIGSTKREQARSIFSIMKKVSRGAPDGRGGVVSNPFASTTNPFSSNYGQSTQSSTTVNAPKEPVDYSNMVIFQPVTPKNDPYAAAKNKTSISSQGTSQKGPLPFVKGAPVAVWDTWSNTVAPKIAETAGKLELGATGIIAGVGEYGQKNIDVTGKKLGRWITGYDPNTAKPLEYTKLGDTWGINQLTGLQEIPQSVSNVAKTVQDTVNGTELTPVSLGSEDPVVPATDPIGIATSKITSQYNGGTGTSQSGVSKDSNPYTAEATTAADRAAAAVANQTGPLSFALDEVEKLFPGGVRGYDDKRDEEIRNELGLPQLEIELSNKTASKENFGPTLTNYITGRDQYLKAIDQMIENTEEALMKQDMGNPAVANSYNNYLKYLYTLKGRQSQRYGNYLNAAIDDFNADLTRLETTYNQTYDRYSEMLNRDVELNQDEYNNQLAAMTDLYNTLDGAEEKALNLEILKLQKLDTQQKISQNAMDAANQTDEKYRSKKAAYLEELTDKDGKLNFSAIGVEGIAGFINKVNLEGKGGNKTAAIDALKQAIYQTAEGGTPEVILKMNQMINELSYIEGGGNILAEDIRPSLDAKGVSTFEQYILSKLPTLKVAAFDLVSKKGPLGANLSQSQAQQLEAEWKVRYKSVIDSNILDALYQVVMANAHSNSNSPKSIIQSMFEGDDQTVAKKITSDIINVQ